MFSCARTHESNIILYSFQCSRSNPILVEGCVGGSYIDVCIGFSVDLSTLPGVCDMKSLKGK